MTYFWLGKVWDLGKQTEIQSRTIVFIVIRQVWNNEPGQDGRVGGSGIIESLDELLRYWPKWTESRRNGVKKNRMEFTLFCYNGNKKGEVMCRKFSYTKTWHDGSHRPEKTPTLRRKKKKFIETTRTTMTVCLTMGLTYRRKRREGVTSNSIRIV